MKEDIENKLHTWSLLMTRKYSWLQVRFEYSEHQGVYLVSFSPASHTTSSDAFNRDALQFEDEMNDIFGDNAPLFEDEERLFKLTPNATMIRANSSTARYMPLVQINVSFHSNAKVSSVTMQPGSKLSSSGHDVAFAA